MSTLKKSKKLLVHIILNIIVWSAVFFVNFPLIWMFLSSIKQERDTYAYPPVIFSKIPTLSHYINLIKLTNFEKYFLNSLIVTFFTVIVTIIIARIANAINSQGR